MAVIGITDAKLRGMKPPRMGRIEISDTVVPGLRIRVGTSGAQTFIVRKRVGGRVRNITLGRFGSRFSLADARKKARTVLSDIEAGSDPTATLATPRMAGVATGTIRAMLPDYLKAKAGKRTVGEIERVFRNYILPEIGDRMADAVTRADVTRLIDKVATGGARETPVMARNVAAQLSAFYSWAMPRLERLPANPCRDAGKPDKAPSRDRVLSQAELVALWRAIEAEPSPWGPGVRLLILTGQRRDEVFNADRAEFDLSARVWTIPAARAMNGVAHIVPLSDSAIAALAGAPAVEGSGKVFASRSRSDNGPSGFSKAWGRIVGNMEKAIGPIKRVTMHDIRRTMATGMQRLGIRMEVTEAVLNHVSGTRGGIAGVYQRHDFAAEKRHALDAWAAEVERITRGGDDRGNVVALR